MVVPPPRVGTRRRRIQQLVAHVMRADNERDRPAAVEQARAAFPTVEVKLRDDRPDRVVRSRRIGRYPITLLRAPAVSAELVGRRAADAGLGDHLKLIWQIGGRTRYEDANRTFDIAPGNAVLTALASDYRLEMLEGHEALVVAFNPADDPRWGELARNALGVPIGMGAGIAAAAGGARTLLSSAASDQTAELAARTMIDLALFSAQPSHAPHAMAEPPLLTRAGLHIVRNIANPTYGPTRLARDMGMSRRSLYARFAALGSTPASFIRQIRLDRARQEILDGDGRSLLSIAMANGFPDGSSLSRAFRTVYGEPPSSLRANR